MREGWKYKTFGEIGTFLRGKSIQKADFVEHGLPCIHYGQIHTKFGVSVDKHLSEIPEEVYNKSIIASPGDVVIAITSEDLEGSCKSTAWLGDYDVAVSSHAAVYKHNLNPKFIAYYLRSNSFFVEKEKYARGFKVMEIKPTDIARIPIPVPSGQIQSRIVAELDKINELIQLKKEQLGDYNILAQSLFYDMFGDPAVNDKNWKVMKLGEICRNCDNLRKPITASDRIPGSIPYYGASGIVDYVKDYIFSSDYLLVSEDGANLLARTTPIAFSISGKTWVNNHAHVLEFKDSETQLYVEYLINSVDISNYITGAVQPKLNQAKLNVFPIPLPPHSLQQLFAQRIELIEQQKAEIQSTIQDLETLLASRMQYWFD